LVCSIVTCGGTAHTCIHDGIDDEWAVRREGRVPGRADLFGFRDTHAAELQRFGELRVRKVRHVLRFLDLGRAAKRPQLVTMLRSRLFKTTTIKRGSLHSRQ